MLFPKDIEAFAKENKIDGIGWFAASDFCDYITTIKETIEYHQIDYRPLDTFLKAGQVSQSIKTIFVIVMDYFIEANDDLHRYKLSNYSRACWQTIGPKSNAISNFLREKGYRAENIDIPHRAAACKAGLGFIGKNTLFYANGVGSYVGIVSVGTDAEVNPSEIETDKINNTYCQNCNRCVEACPVSAISAEGYRINPLRCISFLNRHPDESLQIMPTNADSLQGWLYGCEICQDVCPINKSVVHKNNPVLTSELQLEGMVIPNTSTVDILTIKKAMASIISKGYRNYVTKLLSQRND